ncbi:MAG: glycosyltransferase family 4 protein [Angustibacter sp.]
MRSFVERVRLAVAVRVLARKQPDQSARLVAPLVRPQDRSVRALLVWAQIQDARGDRAAASAAVDRAAALEPNRSAVVVARMRLSTDEGARRHHLAHAVTLAPDPADLKTVLKAIEQAQDVSLATQFVSTLDTHGASSDALAHAQDLAAVLELLRLRNSDEHAYQAMLAKLPSERAIVLAARALRTAGAWEELADLVSVDHRDRRSRQPGSAETALSARATGQIVPSRQLIRTCSSAAWGAMRAGHLSSAVRLARVTLTMEPGRARAQALAADAQDQIAVLAGGWDPPLTAGTPYSPNSGAVLAVLSQSLPVRSGGYATRSHGVLTGLTARGWQIEAVTRLGFPYDRWDPKDVREVPVSDVVDGITYHRLLNPGQREYPKFPLAEYVEQMAGRVAKIATGHRAQLIHASSFYVTGLSGASAAKRLGIPFIYEMRGLEELMKVSRNAAFADTERNQFLRYVEEEVCRQADAVLVITRALRDEMADRGIPAERMRILPNGVHADQFSQQARDRELERELAVEGVPVIGYAGGLVDYEGLDLLVEAAALMKQSGESFRVLIIGDGPRERALIDLVDDARIGDVVTFVGRVPHHEIPKYLSLFDVAAFPRLPLPVCELISPMKPFEAMAASIPVVVSDVAALTEIISDGATGLVFAKGDADDLAAKLRQLLRDGQLRNRLGEAGAAWVRSERDWSVLTKIADETYSEVLERSSAARLSRT